MGLPSSGDISLSDILLEVEGSGYTETDFGEAVADSDPAVSSGVLPADFTDFYGHTQAVTYGRMYGMAPTSSVISYIRDTTNITNIGTISAGRSEELETSMTENVTTKLCKDKFGGDFAASDNVGAVLYRRNKNTSGTWSTISTWAAGAYTSQSVSLAFSTYDYKWELTEPGT